MLAAAARGAPPCAAGGAAAAVARANDVLAEMQRRGVSRDAMLSALARLGRDVPAPAARALAAAAAAGADVRVASACNALFARRVLAAAGLGGVVEDVIAHAAAFERVSHRADDAVGLGAAGAGAGGCRLPRSSSQKLVVSPRAPHGVSAGSASPAAAPACPVCVRGALCRGSEAAAARAAGGHSRVVLIGDGPADICAARALRPGDAVLARAGGALAGFCGLAQYGALAAAVRVWDGPEALEALLAELVPARGGAADAANAAPAS
jgi:phosphoglycolate phosphatase-like HAD superfamily hydrolase